LNTPFEVFRRDVEAIGSRYNTNCLYAEYNHAVHILQMAVKWHDFVADGDRYNLQYRTAGDERVRSEHAALDNITRPPSDPFCHDYLPPNGWNCRCDVDQVLRDLTRRWRRPPAKPAPKHPKPACSATTPGVI
jgi:hypothetical protein